MQVFSPSDQDILRSLIAQRGTDVIPSGSGSAVQNLINTSASPLRSTGELGGQVPGFVAQTDNYRANPRGNALGDMMLDAAGTYGDLSGQFYDGLGRPVRQAKAGAGRMIGRGGRRMAGNAAAALGKVPGMAKAGQILGVAAPALGAVGGALAVGDLVMGQESGMNKAMDATAMTVGGILGSVGGPLGTAAGVGIGKMVSDGTQWLFGDKKTPEQRKMELALAELRGGVI